LFFSSSFNISLNSSRFREFSSAFQKRFGYSVNFASSNGYDCANILFTAYKKSRAQYSLKDAIIDIGIFKGVQGELSLNQYGDVKRDYYLMTIKDGQFSSVE
jgi:branched-chain amino acid transport system substrate-binding protein